MKRSKVPQVETAAAVVVVDVVVVVVAGDDRNIRCEGARYSIDSQHWYRVRNREVGESALPLAQFRVHVDPADLDRKHLQFFFFFIYNYSYFEFFI